MKGTLSFLIIPVLIGLSSSALAHKSNPFLAYTMKTIAKDLTVVTEPAKKANPADVTDGAIMNAIMRVRTTVAQLQLSIDRMGKFEGDKFVSDELTPNFNDETPEKQKELLKLYPTFLEKVIEKLKLAETQLKTEFPKEADARDFRPLKATLAEIDTMMTDAHKLFRPE